MEKQTVVEEILAHNKRFVAHGEGLVYQADTKPRKHLAVVTCMDTRLTVMLAAALGLENGDANVIKVAGAEVKNPYGTAMRSLLVGVYVLGVRDIMVIGHTECGTQHMSCSGLSSLMRKDGVPDEAFEAATVKGVDLEEWLEGFENLEASVQSSVDLIQNHPLMPASVGVHGFIIDTQTGELTAV